MWRWSRPIAANFSGGWSGMPGSVSDGLDRDGATLGGRPQHGVNQVVYAQCLAAGDARGAIPVDRVEEIGKQGAVRIVGKRHRIGAAAGALLLAGARLAPVLVMDRDHAGGDHRSALA